VSSTLVYHIKAFRLDPEVHHDLYLHFEESAQSNVTTRGGTPARSWCLRGVGSRLDVLLGALEAAADCEEGSLKLGGRTVRAESYFSRVEAALDIAEVNPLGWRPQISVPALGVDTSLLELGFSERVRWPGTTYEERVLEGRFSTAARWLRFVLAHPNLPRRGLATFQPA